MRSEGRTWSGIACETFTVPVDAVSGSRTAAPAGDGHRKFVFLAAATRYAMDLPHEDVTDESPAEPVDDEDDAWTEPSTAEDDVTEAVPYVKDPAPDDRSPGATRRGGHSRHRRRPRRAHAKGAFHITIDDDEDSPVIPSPVLPFSTQASRSSSFGAPRVETAVAPRSVSDGASPAKRRLALVALLLLLGLVAVVAQAARPSGTSGEATAASSDDNEESTSTTVSAFVVLPQVPEQVTTTTSVPPPTATFPPVTPTRPTKTPTTRFVSATTRPAETNTTTVVFAADDPQPTTNTQPPSTTTTQAPTTTTTAATTTTTTSFAP